MKKIVSEKPSRRMVEALLKDLFRQYPSHAREYGYEWKALNKKRSEVEKKLLRSRELAAITKRMEQIQDKVDRKFAAERERVNAIWRKYHATGVTDKVLRDLNDLVDSVNKGSA